MISLFAEPLYERMKLKLRGWHDLFHYCSPKAEFLEEIFASSLDGAYSAEGVEVDWTPFSHRKDRDILVKQGDEEAKFSIKTGQLVRGKLVISGYRLGRFGGDFAKINEFLTEEAHKQIHLALPSTQENGAVVYSLFRIDPQLLCPSAGIEWAQRKNSFYHRNESGVQLAVHPSMSWQVWWEIPVDQAEKLCEIVVLNEVSSTQAA